MKIVIDIPEEVYKSIQDNDYCEISNGDMYNAVKNGTPLCALKNEQTDGDLISKQDLLFSLSYYELEDVIDEQDFGFNHAIQTIRSDVMEMKTYSAEIPQEFIDILTKCVEMSIDKLKGMSAEEMLEIYRNSTKEDTAEWIDFETARKQGYKCGSCECLCSNCKEPAVDEYRFCPNCGAKMNESEKEE